jgi:WhiB family redox-sensing transcriptional regulator
MSDPRSITCKDHGELFFGTSEDGRMEEGRVEREALAAAVCFSCPIRVGCLEKALVLKEAYGVWGGMGEGERRRFAKHVKKEGYKNEVPPQDELSASLVQFYLADDLLPA